MARFEQEYCLGCTNRFGDGCAIPTNMDRAVNYARKINDIASAAFLGVSRSTMLGGQSEVDFYEATRKCADERFAAEVQPQVPLQETAVIIQFPLHERQ